MIIKLDTVMTAVMDMRTSGSLIRKLSEELQNTPLGDLELKLIERGFSELSPLVNKSLALLESLSIEITEFKELFVKTEALLRERLGHQKKKEYFCTAWDDPDRKEE